MTKLYLVYVWQFLAPILLSVLTLAMADDVTRDPNLYQFLDFTRVQSSQKNENRHFKWFGKLRRSKNQKSAEQASTQPEEHYDSEIKLPLLQAAFKIAPVSFRDPGKKSKQSPYIVLPPLPSINQAKSVVSQDQHPIYVSKQDSAIHQPGPPYSQTQPAPISPAQNTQSSSYSAPQQTPSYSSPSNSPVSPNPESEYSVSPPAHSDSRYSKWFSKLKRRKSNQQHQPEKPQHESEKVQDKPPSHASGVPETLFYYQNGSPYNKPSQPVATQNQPGNGQSPASLPQPQIANSSPQLAPARPVHIQPQSAAHPGAPSSPVKPINFDARDSIPHSITEVLEQAPPSGNLYSKFMKKIKRNKTQKPEPVNVVNQPEPIFTPIRTSNIPPTDLALYQHPQSSPHQPPPVPVNIVKPQPTATHLPSDPAVNRRPQLPSQPSPPGPANIVKPQPTASPVPHSSHHQASNKPALARPEAATPSGNSSTKRPLAPVEQPPHHLFPESENFFPPPSRPDFVPAPFQKQSEKGQGNSEGSDGFFEFGIFPNSNGFFDQNFEG